MKSNNDFAYLVEHHVELCEQYPGKWIAVGRDGVIGVGDTAVEAADQARQHAPDGDFILEAIDSNADVIYAHP